MSSRRAFLTAAVGMPLVGTMSRVHAQGLTGPIRLVIPGPPGGGADAIARIMAEGLQAKVGQSVYVDPRPGASGKIANEFVRSQPANGQTLYLSSGLFASGPALDPEVMKYDPVHDFTPVARLTENVTLLLVKSTLPVNTLAEFIAYCKANPGKVNVATVGQGSSTHLMATYLAKTANLDVNLPHYKGSAPGNQDLMAGIVHAKFDNLASVRTVVDGGFGKVIAIGNQKRVPLYPNVATFSETIPGLVWEDHFVIIAPPRMPAELTDRISKYFAEIVQTPAVKDRLRDQLGAIAAPLNPADTSRVLKSAYEKQKELVSKVDLK